MGNIGIQNLAALLGQDRADFAATVGPGSAAQVLVLAGLNLTSTSMSNGYVLLDADALGAGTPKTLAQIASNTADTLTLTAALTAAPAVGSDIWLYTETTVNVVASENVSQWGGIPVAPADVNGVPQVNVVYSTGTPNSPAPAKAMQVAGQGPNGTLRVIATDALGNLRLEPIALVWDAAGEAVTAATNVFPTSYTPPGPGKLDITIGNLSSGAASVASLVKTANTAPSGGSAGTRVFAMNDGATLTAGNMYSFSLDVTPNDSYNMQFGNATTVDITATFDPTA